MPNGLRLLSANSAADSDAEPGGVPDFLHVEGTVPLERRRAAVHEVEKVIVQLEEQKVDVMALCLVELTEPVRLFDAFFGTLLSETPVVGNSDACLLQSKLPQSCRETEDADSNGLAGFLSRDFDLKGVDFGGIRALVAGRLCVLRMRFKVLGHGTDQTIAQRAVAVAVAMSAPFARGKQPGEKGNLSTECP